MADTHAAAVSFLNALERIPTIIDRYKAKNEVLEREIPQLREIAGKVWKKEDELKQLKSELAALDRKIPLELALPTPEVTQQTENGQQMQGNHEDKPMQVEHPSSGISPTENRISSVQPESRSCSVHYPGKFRL